jgi:hypothetical protein
MTFAKYFMKIPFQKLLVIIGIAALAVPFLEVSVTNQVRDSFDDFTNVSKGFIVVFMGVIACGFAIFILQVVKWFKK